MLLFVSPNSSGPLPNTKLSVHSGWDFACYCWVLCVLALYLAIVNHFIVPWPRPQLSQFLMNKVLLQGKGKPWYISCMVLSTSQSLLDSEGFLQDCFILFFAFLSFSCSFFEFLLLTSFPGLTLDAKDGMKMQAGCVWKVGPDVMKRFWLLSSNHSHFFYNTQLHTNTCPYSICWDTFSSDESHLLR